MLRDEVFFFQARLALLYSANVKWVDRLEMSNSLK